MRIWSLGDIHLHGTYWVKALTTLARVDGFHIGKTGHVQALMTYENPVGVQASAWVDAGELTDNPDDATREDDQT